ncbi:LOW QUALITY PROTEIN: hypothetical protein HID58_095206, partial [Brassica napus]
MVDLFKEKRTWATTRKDLIIHEEPHIKAKPHFEKTQSTPSLFTCPLNRISSPLLSSFVLFMCRRMEQKMARKKPSTIEGNPPDNSKTGGWLGAGLILGSELSERICVMGISMNLVTYLVGDLHISSAKSATIVTNFMGTLNLLGLLGGFLADAKLGRYKMVAISASVTALGVLLLTVATTIPSMRPPLCDDFRRLHHQSKRSPASSSLRRSLHTIALGGGGIKSNVSGFGSDQFDTSDPKEEKQMIFFFNRFYFSISLGSLFAVIVLVYVQDNVGRGWATESRIAAAWWLRPWFCSAGRNCTVSRNLKEALLPKRNQSYPSHQSLLNGYDNTTVSPHGEAKMFRPSCEESSPSTKEFKEKDPWMVSTVTQVEEVKLVVKLIPIWATNILFWTIYSQMTTFTVEQATFMERKLGSFTVPAGSYSAFLILTILLFTSLNERVFVPLARMVTKKPQGITSLQRIGVGLVLSMAAMAVAAVIENARREAEHQYKADMISVGVDDSVEKEKEKSELELKHSI